MTMPNSCRFEKYYLDNEEDVNKVGQDVGEAVEGVIGEEVVEAGKEKAREKIEEEVEDEKEDLIEDIEDKIEAFTLVLTWQDKTGLQVDIEKLNEAGEAIGKNFAD